MLQILIPLSTISIYTPHKFAINLDHIVTVTYIGFFLEDYSIAKE